MARAVRDQNLASRQARSRLGERQLYWRLIDRGLHIGYRRGKNAGRWLMRMYVEAGRYVTVTVGTADDINDADGVEILDFSQAQAAVRQLFHAKTLAASGGTVKGRYTVKDALDAYFAESQRIGRKRVADYRTRSKSIIEPAFGSTAVAKLRTDDIRGWLDQIVKTPPRVRSKRGEQPSFQLVDKIDDPDFLRRRRATANRALNILRAALNYAWREGKADSDTAWRRVKPYAETECARTRFLSIVECQRLINASGPSLRNLVKAALFTGARYGELAALNVADFDPLNGSVHIRHSKSGKGRHVVLNAEGIAFFKEIATGRLSSLPMLTHDSGSRWDKNLHTRPFHAAMSAATITDFTFHGLRHTYASLSIMNGAPLIVVAANLGHADTRMCERHYGHLTTSYVKQVVKETAPRFELVAENKVVGLR